MIQKALQFTNTVLNQFLRNKFGMDASPVIINNLVEANGSIHQINENKIVISLINIERETLKPYYNRNHELSNSEYSNIAPTEHYNLFLLITSNFDDYNETLKFLNAVILFFQSHPSLSSSTNSQIPKELHKLDYFLEKVSYRDMHSLWSSLGAKYQPSVLYRMRLISIQSNEAHSFTPSITQITDSVQA